MDQGTPGWHLLTAKYGPILLYLIGMLDWMSLALESIPIPMKGPISPGKSLQEAIWVSQRHNTHTRNSKYSLYYLYRLQYHAPISFRISFSILFIVSDIVYDIVYDIVFDVWHFKLGWYHLSMIYINYNIIYSDPWNHGFNFMISYMILHMILAMVS